ncbi:phosphodiester glycosidase family protein [Actinomadura keratinilytica]|uniref:Phosphodiester glycosidase domain-containing protein n=1 Tax=Actinomadura keratinilytica TaxID=547461 RepID=A0ABP6ULI1_9ACTN
MISRFAAVLVTAGAVMAVCAFGPGPESGPATARASGPGDAGGGRLPDVDGAGSGERPGTPASASRAAVPLGMRYTASRRVSPGILARSFHTRGVAGRVAGHLLEVDLADRHVDVGLLHPPVVAARRKVSAMVRAQRAVAGVNGDFFNIGEVRAGVEATGAASGAEVDRGRPRKGAVPVGQRFGPPLPPAGSVEDVIGVDRKRVGHVSRLRLTGTIRSGRIVLPVRGLNQYALPVDGAGVFTSKWGKASRLRAVCGTDLARNAPCSSDVAEVTVRRGVVADVRGTVGRGAIPRGTIVLVGREEAAAELRELRRGDRVRVRYRLAGRHRYRFAIGGFRILHGGRPVAGLADAEAAPRTAAGVSRDGRRMYLMVVDGRSERSAGVTLVELARLMGQAGADDAVNLDGGGSSTLVIGNPRGRAATVRNTPSDGAERPVANGIGLFVRR